MKFSDIPRNPNSRTLWQFAGLWILLFGTIAGLQLYKSSPWGWAILGLALLVGVPGLIWPRLLKPIFIGWMILAFPIGWLISHIILSLIFYGLFTAIGLMLKLTGYDPLRRVRPRTESYWETKTQPADISRYLKQF